ncbi:restriction endonuclease subunit S [Nitrosomonas sp.]|uniref:restriction endonuclease subunit S n=1 Tax=Nitrosomonas sp. TaxID=42353 RepID=UPI00261EE81D|nr:restriction endonuclease subunit S [Nitrosomonas sp.]MCW5602644.1 restriction endonuclease subunit S [Nitrosomonas sp.]
MTRSLSFVHSRLRVSDLLEQHFDTAFAVPDGIARLRELILTLAMQGKLVEQDPNDPPASELLKEIEKEKASHEGTKTRRKEKLPPVKPEEVPYELPKGWEWVRLGDIVLSITGGGTPSKNNPAFWGGDIPWASVKDLNVETYLDSTIDSITEKAIASSSTNLIPKGRIIICTRMGLGKIAINRVAVAINQDLKALRISSHVDQMFFFKKYKNYKITGSGMTVHGIRQDELLNFLFPLPPLPEQHRIVARIDQLMARCDELEKLRKEREVKRLAVHAAAIKQLLDPSLCAFAPSREENSSTLRAFVPSCEPFAFLDQHFGELYTVKKNVAELRKAILQLAVMGRLVPQDPNDPPASELLKAIEKEKASREGTKTRRGKEKKLPPIKPEEVPYQLPQGWEWVRFAEIAFQITDGAHHTPTYIEDGIPFLSVKDMSSGLLDFSDTRFISPEQHQELIKRCYPQKGDLLLTKVGTTGIPVLVDVDFEFSIFVSVALIKFPQQLVSGKFLSLLVKAPLVKKQSEDGTEGVGNKNLVLRKIANFILPLPPLPEQHRIVARIDQLMALCDTLDQQIDAATGKQTELLNAVMAAV